MARRDGQVEAGRETPEALLGSRKRSEMDCGDACSTENTLKATESYTLENVVDM